jgi:hypothetical protein
VSPVKYKLGFYIPGDDILHSDRRENINSYSKENNFKPLGMNKIQVYLNSWRISRISNMPRYLASASTFKISVTNCRQTVWCPLFY